jgi:serpin B
VSAQQASGQQADVADSVRAFTAELYGQLARTATTPDNIVVSPYSAAAALGMTLAGAQGETAAQIGRVLHVAADDAAAFGGLGSELAGAGESSAEVTLDLANSLWAQQDLGWKQEFLTALETGYKAAFQQADFKADAGAAAERINRWVADQTHARITELFSPGQLDADTRLALVNAAYFKATWEQPFTDRTADRRFTLADGSTVKLSTMSQTVKKVGLGSGPGWQAVQLDFVGGRIAMALVLPDGPLADLEESLSGAVVAELLEPYDTVGSLHVQLPKWTFRSRYELTEQLTQLGMPLAFDRRSADFGRMTEDEPLVIGTVVQEAYVAVDEQGAEATAATGVGMVRAAALARPRELIFDRPFLFMIFDRQTRVPIFVGRVTDPRG